MKTITFFNNRFHSNRVITALIIAIVNVAAVLPVVATPLVKIDTRLYNSGNIMLDANVVVFDVAYPNAVGVEDALKLSNPAENFGIQRGSSILVIEGRQPALLNDVVPFRMWNMHQQNYRLDLVAANMVTPGLTAYLEDAYLNSSTAINPNGTTVVNFTVDANSASSAINRFRIIFKQAATVLPVTFISISANRSAGGVTVGWKVAAESNIRQYEVQRSTDGSNFSTAGIVPASGNSNTDLSYHLLDGVAPQAVVFYRIKSAGTAGDSKFSSIVKVGAGDSKQGMAIATNPVENGVINLQLNNQQAGQYSVRLINNAGQLIMTGTVNHAGGSSTALINIPGSATAGIYRLQVAGAGNSNFVQTVVISNR